MIKKETKRERFIRIVERRVNKLLNDLDSIGKCANRRNYEYTEDDVRKIFTEIEKKTKIIKTLYENQRKKNRGFKLVN